MSLKASKENQIFDRREDVTASEETARAKAYVKEHKDDPDGYMELGLCLRRQMFFREAVEAYSVGISYDPFRCLLYRHRGHAYVNLGLYHQAAADFEMGLRLNPENWDCWYHLGLSYHVMGEYERALKAYDTCYELAASDEFRICTVDWMCMTLMKMGRIDEMREYAKRIRPDMIQVIPQVILSAFWSITELYKRMRSLHRQRKKMIICLQREHMGWLYILSV